MYKYIYSKKYPQYIISVVLFFCDLRNRSIPPRE